MNRQARIIFALFTAAWLLGGGAYAQPEVLPAPPLELPDADTLAELRAGLNICRDTPLGRIAPGGDITKALQWALAKAHDHQQAIVIPAGNYQLSEMVSSEFRSGLTLLGTGIGSITANDQLRGVRTVIEWAGPKDGTAIRFIGSGGRIGNFCIDGKGKLGIGLLIDKPLDLRGLNVGKTIFEPLKIDKTTFAVQNGANAKADNCDNLTFTWLEGSHCRALYHGVNEQGMDIVIQRLVNQQNQYGVEMDGGGHLWVQTSLTTHAGTLLKINRGSGNGPNNAFYRFSHIKVDNQAVNGFCAVDCESPSEIRILLDGGIQANTEFVGTFAKLYGSNFLHITDFSSTFYKIIGRRHPGWGKPSVLLEACRIWGMIQDENGQWIQRPVDQLFEGDLNARVVSCTRQKGEGGFIDWDSRDGKPLSVQLIETHRRFDRVEAELKKLRAAKVRSTFEVEE